MARDVKTIEAEIAAKNADREAQVETRKTADHKVREMDKELKKLDKELIEALKAKNK